ncbi:MAG: tyrosine-type recombinase/integrase [Lachnospiraceae bacterium]|jgi:integrase/recombinase XerD|nr:tyrosine-type recombinase/integrase [Lachnospiraceae bacterium]
MVQNQNSQYLLENFINTQAVSRRLDKRTMEAYRLDLDLFFRWAQIKKNQNSQHLTIRKTGKEEMFSEYGWEEAMETYLTYLSEEKGLRSSTIFRKYLVFGYYLTYLKAQGVIKESRPLRQPSLLRETLGSVYLTNDEIDQFFQAIDQEYERLDSDFRKRVCLRDQVMLELLFYHGIEVSELLRMEIADYHRKTAVLSVPRKREKNRTVQLFSPRLREKMERWLEVHEYFEHDALYRNHMFLSKLGKPLSMKMMVNIVDKYRIMAGIGKECTPKDLKNGLGRYGMGLVKELADHC